VPAHVWDEKHLKALLRLPRYPMRLIQQAPWQPWIEERGGIRAVVAYLRTCTLPQNQRDLLEAILAHPEASVQFYSDKLCVSPRTYDNHLKDLIAFLLPHLNAWRMPLTQALAPTSPLINLPAPLTSLVGAEPIVAEVVTLLRRAEVRLVTITGPGGVGKTRTAIQAAREVVADFSDGVGFVPLDPVNDPALLTTQIVQVLHLEKDYDQPAPDVLRPYLWGRRFLLVLDNFEHLIAAAPVVFDLLQMAPDLKILVTSREALHLYGEHHLTVPTLSLPDAPHSVSGAQGMQGSAVRLFVERARAVRSGFALDAQNGPLIAEICRLLDGLPLAIELAAACIKWYSLDQIRDRLGQSLQLLDEGWQGLPPRHRVLRNTIAWSYNLLSPAEQTLFRRTSIFESGWTLAAASAVFEHGDSVGLLHSLADKSLIRLVPDEMETRFEMLHTIRQYGQEQLDTSGETAHVYRLRATYYVELAEEAERDYSSPRQTLWFPRLKKEYDNLRAVLQWAINAEEFEVAFRLVGAIWQFWQQSGLLEIQRWVELALARGQHVSRPARSKALWGAGWLLGHQGKVDLAYQRFQEGFQLAQRLEEERLMGLNRQGLGDILRYEHRFDEAQQVFEDSVALFRRLNDEAETAWSLDHLARVWYERGELHQAQPLFNESIAIFRRLGHVWGMSNVLDHMGRVAVNMGDYPRAQAFFEESVSLVQAQNPWGSVWTYEALSNTLMVQGEYAKAEILLSQSLAQYINIQNVGGILTICEGFAALWAARADYAHAVQLVAAVQTLAQAQQIVLARLNLLRMQSTLAIGRQHLDPAAFESAWATGASLNIDEAVALVRDVQGTQPQSSQGFSRSTR
jgi:predicted ATPase